jgi:hypothetical protein
MNWNSVVEGVTAGVSASVILGTFALSRNRFRDLVFRFRLRREFRFPSCGHNLDGITMGLRNHLGKCFTIRHVAIVTDVGNFRLNPTGEVSSSFKKSSLGLTRKLLKGRLGFGKGGWVDRSPLCSYK